ncbi:hypothetical protein [Sphingomonas spermidinifaciens]|nr:hypothetical protein [Sphingomonas spermidinifaciens]
MAGSNGDDPEGSLAEVLLDQCLITDATDKSNKLTAGRPPSI